MPYLNQQRGKKGVVSALPLSHPPNHSSQIFACHQVVYYTLNNITIIIIVFKFPNSIVLAIMGVNVLSLPE